MEVVSVAVTRWKMHRVWVSVGVRWFQYGAVTRAMFTFPSWRWRVCVTGARAFKTNRAGILAQTFWELFYFYCSQQKHCLETVVVPSARFECEQPIVCCLPKMCCASWGAVKTCAWSCWAILDEWLPDVCAEQLWLCHAREANAGLVPNSENGETKLPFRMSDFCTVQANNGLPTCHWPA